MARPPGVAYRAAKDELIYTPGAPTAYPIAELHPNRPIVSEIWHDAEDANPSHFTYQYAGQRLDFSGRGGLGFDAFVTHDRQTNFLKYQFITHSFPMTGLTGREQTLWYWEKGGTTFLKFISSTDHKVLFDAVRNPFTHELYGTVYSFTAQTVEERSANDAVADFFYPSTDAGHGLHFDSQLPASMKFRTTSNFWRDDQLLTEAPPTSRPWINMSNYLSPKGTTDASSLPNDFASNYSRLPGKITAGNLVRSDVSSAPGQWKREANLYRPPQGPDDPLVNQIEATASAEKNEKGLAVEPVVSYRYSGTTKLLQTETTDARAATHGKPRRITEVNYQRDAQGRTLEKRLHTVECNPTDSWNTESISYKAGSFDDVVDLATKEVDDEGYSTRLVYNPLFREPSSYTYANGHIAIAVHDPLGRLISMTNAATGYFKTTDYAWTTADGEGWKLLQRVSPPRESGGLLGESLYAVRVSEKGKPTTITYYDRRARVIRVVSGNGVTDQTSTDTAFNAIEQDVATSKPYRRGAAIQWHVKAYDGYGLVEHETDVEQPGQSTENKK